MPNKTNFIDAGRRRFVQTSAIVGSVAASTVAATTSAADPAPADTTLSSRHAGYQLTDRVREYYRKARF